VLKIISFVSAMLLVGSSLYAVEYEGCSVDKKDALVTLSGNIRSTINNSFTSSTKTVQKSGKEESSAIEQKISSYINTATNLSLVNIKYRNKKKLVCAYVNKKDQVENTKKLLAKALLYDEKNLPNDIDTKVKKLDEWIKDIVQLNYLIPVFLDNVTKEQAILNKKEKIFRDLYNENLVKSNNLIWKSCAPTKEEATKELNAKLFLNVAKKEESGFFSGITKLFNSSDEEEMILPLFKDKLKYTSSKEQQCVIIKKEELFKVAKKMNTDMQHFSIKNLDEDPKKKYKEVQTLLAQLKITQSLVKLYPSKFSQKDIANLVKIKTTLQDILANTYPQYVLFEVEGAQKIKIKLDAKDVANNKKIYLKEGAHNYSLTAKGKCPVSDSFSLDKFDEQTIEYNFEDKNYPSIIFVTDKNPTIVLDGKSYKANVNIALKKCDGDVRWVVKYAGQTRSGEIALKPNLTESIELNFLTQEELNVFNDAKTKHFKTTANRQFSESLTPVTNETLEFSVDDDVKHGSLELHERGSFKYKPDEGFVGDDDFSYTIEANGKTSAPKVVVIHVSAAPVTTHAIASKEKEIAKKQKTPKSDAEVLKLKKELEALKKALAEKKAKEKLQKQQQPSKPVTQEIKKEEPKKVAKAPKQELKEKVIQKVTQVSDEKYEKFKAYIERLGQERNMAKIQALKEKYPELFSRFLKEKLGQ